MEGFFMPSGSIRAPAHFKKRGGEGEWAIRVAAESTPRRMPRKTQSLPARTRARHGMMPGRMPTFGPHSQRRTSATRAIGGNPTVDLTQEGVEDSLFAVLVFVIVLSQKLNRYIYGCATDKNLCRVLARCSFFVPEAVAEDTAASSGCFWDYFLEKERRAEYSDELSLQSEESYAYGNRGWDTHPREDGSRYQAGWIFR